MAVHRWRGLPRSGYVVVWWRPEMRFARIWLVEGDWARLEWVTR